MLILGLLGPGVVAMFVLLVGGTGLGTSADNPPLPCSTQEPRFQSDTNDPEKGSMNLQPTHTEREKRAVPMRSSFRHTVGRRPPLGRLRCAPAPALCGRLKRDTQSGAARIAPPPPPSNTDELPDAAWRPLRRAMRGSAGKRLRAFKGLPAAKVGGARWLVSRPVRRHACCRAALAPRWGWGVSRGGVAQAGPFRMPVVGVVHGRPQVRSSGLGPRRGRSALEFGRCSIFPAQILGGVPTFLMDRRLAWGTRTSAPRSKPGPENRNVLESRALIALFRLPSPADRTSSRPLAKPIIDIRWRASTQTGSWLGICSFEGWLGYVLGRSSAANVGLCEPRGPTHCKKALGRSGTPTSGSDGRCLVELWGELRQISSRFGVQLGRFRAGLGRTRLSGQKFGRIPGPMLIPGLDVLGPQS